MAEVYLARRAGPHGFQKIVAIKKILPHIADNDEFITMFADEAKLAAQLNHPNIVHIYDLGKIQAGGYFIAMEGVDEMHLLNLTVAPAEQGQGHARRMLDALVAICRERHAAQLWLEVRESNSRARALYLRYGFRHVGVRRDYYPAEFGRREDATVMSLVLEGVA